MAVCIRYPVGLETFERFLGFIDTSEKQDAESLYCHILKYLKYCNLSQALIVSQSYDGANVMTEKFNGIQAK